jgi:predicted RNase H-like nuclease (RuvC/YqgF family)
MSHITGAHDETHQGERGEQYASRIVLTEVGEDEPDRSQPMPSVVESVHELEQRVDESEKQIEMTSQWLESVESMAMENAQLRDRVEELEQLVESMRADLAGLYAGQGYIGDGRHAVQTGEETVWVPDSVNPYDPLQEFDR